MVGLIAGVCKHIAVTTFEVRRAAKRLLGDCSYELFEVDLQARDAPARTSNEIASYMYLLITGTLLYEAD